MYARIYVHNAASHAVAALCVGMTANHAHCHRRGQMGGWAVEPDIRAFRSTA